MATFSSLSSSSLILLSLTTTSLFLLTNGSPLVDNVCGQTRDPSLCKMYLTSDTRSETADLPLLAEITIDLAGYRANAVKQKIHEGLLRATDPTLHGIYVQCENLYLDALDELFRAAPGELKGQQYGALGQLGVRVRGQVDACEAAFNNNSPFKIENQVVAVLADAIAVIARNL